MTLLIHYININGVMWYKPYLRFKTGSNKTVQVCCHFVLASVCSILVQITWFFLNWKIGCQSTCPQDFINLSQVFLTQQNNLCESDQHLNSFVAHCKTCNIITGIELDSNLKPDFRKACAKAKPSQQPFPKELETWATKYSEHVHWDLWGLAAVKSLNRHFYVAAQIDDASWETKLYFQEKKSKMFESYKIDKANIETQTRNRIKCMCLDQGGEFKSDAMRKHQDQKGTEREFTVQNSPPQNGVAERGMRTRAEWVHTLLISSSLPHFLWEEAMKHSTWLKNRTPACANNGKSPYQVKTQKKLNLAGIQEFGAAAYMKDLKARKQDTREKKGWFDSESKGYRIY